MNKYFIALAGILTFGLVSCTNDKYAPYEPAQKESGSQVYFSNELPESYNLKDYDKGSFEFDIYRVDASTDAVIGLTVQADAAFTVSKSVTFPAGETVAYVKVSWDDAQVVEATDYTISVSVADQATVYGNSSYSFTVSKPAAWIKWKKVHVKEGWWGEEEDEYMYYQDLGNDTYLCKIENCFDTGGGADPTDIVFTWNTAKNTLDVEKQYMGWEYQAGYPVYFYDWYAYFTTDGGYTPAQLGDRDNFYLKNGDAYPRGYYDGNGGFYFNMKYYIPGLGGWTPDPFDLVAIAEGFIRTTNYNDDYHYGASAPVYTGEAASMFFGQDTTAYEFDSFLRYDAPADSTAGTLNTFYLGEYFTESNCLAFTAPINFDKDGKLFFEDGAPITDVENDQPTGCQIFGNDIWVSVKGGFITVPTAAGSYPIFNIILKVYCKDAAGNKTYDFGTLLEVFTADGILKDNYTWKDVYGGYFEDYLGKWNVTSTTYSATPTPRSYQINILDGGNNTYKIANLSGYGNYFADTLVATYDSNYYVMAIHPQTLNATYNSQQVKLYLLDPDAGKIYSAAAAEIDGGICTDGNLAFVNIYSNMNLCGFYYTAGSSGLCGFCYAYGSADAASGTSPFKLNKRKEYVTAPFDAQGAASTSVKFTKADDNKVTAVKNFSRTPAEKNGRHSEISYPSNNVIL